MRKVLVAILIVAGLLAVVLALASGPATAANKVVTIKIGDHVPSIGGDQSVAGEYTVSWETLGGCDPGAGTSGKSGSVTLTVAVLGSLNPGGTDPSVGDLLGVPVETGVTINDICTYEWTGSLVEAATAAPCAVTDADSADGFGPDTSDEIVISVASGDCATSATIVIEVNPVTTDELGTADVDEGALDRGAILATTFTATATPVEDSADECSAVSAESEVNEESTPNDTSDDTVGLEFVLVDETSSNMACVYDVTLTIPAGFSLGLRSNIFRGIDPRSGVVSIYGTNLGVASRTVYLVQNVVGDAGGVSVVYQRSSACGAPGLPGALSPRAASGGIVTVAGSTITELRRGRFNVSEAIASVDGWSVAALNDEGEGCEATVTVSGLPDGCSSSASQTADLEDSDDTVILEFSVDCTPPAEEPPMEEPPMEEPPMEEPPMEEPPMEEPTGPKQDTPTG